MYWEIIATIIGALGGWEAIKYLINRKTNKRKFDLPACAHDRAYDVGGSEADRLRADRALLDDMLSLCTNGTQLLFAAFYYCMVRIFGRLFFRYDE